MPIFMLGDDILFPDPALANRKGLLAVGGDLSIERLLEAYRNGIFPWYGEESPILWWSPDPRMILKPSEFKFTKSLRQTIKNAGFRITFDHNFFDVIRLCAGISRKGEAGTWITPEMIDAYCALHDDGYAHSVEAYLGERLVGGLYGVSIGKAFFGESMFHLARDASKVALAERLLKGEFHFIDAQQKTEHLRRMGARPVSRRDFLENLKLAVIHPTIRGKW